MREPLRKVYVERPGAVVHSFRPGLAEAGSSALPRRMHRFGLTVLPLLLAGLTSAGTSTVGTPISSARDAGWPLLPGPDRVVRDFDPPAEPWLAGNRGLDLAGRPGEAVHAATAGVVTFAGEVAGVGVVSVTDGPLRTTYEPVAATVHRGQRVRLGEALGRLTLAGSHCAPAACLHWGLLRDGNYLDPLALLGLERVVLLPLTS